MPPFNGRRSYAVNVISISILYGVSLIYDNSLKVKREVWNTQNCNNLKNVVFCKSLIYTQLSSICFYSQHIVH